MNIKILCTTVLASGFLLLGGVGCSTGGGSSEAAWARAQCAQINDDDARKKCLERVGSEYGRK